MWILFSFLYLSLFLLAFSTIYLFSSSCTFLILSSCKIKLNWLLTISKGRFHEFFKVKVALFIAQSIKLSCKLDNFDVWHSHLNKDFLNSVQLNETFLVVLLAQQSKRVFNVNFVELGVCFKRKDAQEVGEAQ